MFKSLEKQAIQKKKMHHKQKGISETKIENDTSNEPLTYGIGKIVEQLNYETANNKIKIETSTKKKL